MPEKLSYKTAIEELEKIANQIENEEPDIDELGKMVKRAKDLILFCKKRLKTTEEDIESALGELED
ncbi:MAG: exodeoxyribonuclease VII small subunit [Bacteroidetes bacterium]|nr:exodeoxyribonuclease VII small subunit [Bacteroidota bacterium]MDA1121599.1 exodeoxyribonuclease VII small subunit [Bacteroidota bacterium]